MTALALAALGATTAHAAMIPLQNATITATYNGEAAGMLGLDHQFAAGPGANTTGLDPLESGVEFLTADFLFGIDLSASGALTVIANSAIPSGPYSMRFDFGSSLASAITSFTWADANGASGMPVLSVVDAHTIALDLGAVEWSEYGSLTAAIGTAAPVPEPGSAALLVAGLIGLGLVRHTRQPRC
jgi:hypothetical protein